MIHYKWLILAAIVLVWYAVSRDDMRSTGIGSGIGCAFFTLVAVILILIWYIIFF